MDQFLGLKPQDFERAMLRARLDGSGSDEDMRRAMTNPEEYTTSRQIWLVKLPALLAA